jgi:hypothetical protein
MPTIKGKIRSLNLSPKGHFESFLLEDAKRVVQINLDPHSAVSGLVVGEVISVNAEPWEDERPSSHPVFAWTDPPKAALKGVVKQINYALHGEPNGAILDTGEFVHMKPEGAKAVKLKLGQSLTVEGESKTSADGHVVIEAGKVNGIEMHGKKKKKKKH